MQNNPGIYLIAVGGTIASTPAHGSGAGLTPTRSGNFLLDYTFQHSPDLEKYIDPRDIYIKDLMRKDSTDLLLRDRKKIAEAIKEARDANYTRIVLLHGTDQLTNSATYTSFAMPYKDFSVIYTGAMSKIEKPGSDGVGNVSGALLAALDSRFIGDTIHFRGNLLRGVRALKTGRDEAEETQEDVEDSKNVFESPHYPIIASRNNSHFDYTENGRAAQEAFTDRTEKWLERFDSDGMPFFNIEEHTIKTTGLIELYEDFAAEQIYDSAKNLDCIVLKSWGKGGIPNTPEGEALSDEILKWTRDGKVVVIGTMVPYFSVDLTQYEVGIRALKAGAIPTFDMRPHVALTKLRWAKSLTSYKKDGSYRFDPETVKRMMLYNVADEINPKLETLKEFMAIDKLKISDDEIMKVYENALVKQAREREENERRIDDLHEAAILENRMQGNGYTPNAKSKNLG